MKITYDKGVLEELINLSAYLADENEELAQRFLNSCDQTFRFLASNPQIGSARDFVNPVLSDIKCGMSKASKSTWSFTYPSQTV